MILVNKKESRILFIPYFAPGSFWYDGLKIKEVEDSKMKAIPKNKFTSMYKPSEGEAALRELSSKSELESGTTLLDGNIRYSITAEKSNFNHTIAVNENHMIVLGEEKILSAKLFHWEDYLKYVQKQCDWLVCLRVALDIYHGEMKGYYGVPYIKEERENALKHKMKDLISEGIRAMIKNFNRNANKSTSKADFQADNIAIKAAVEFCHRINSFQYLFVGIIKLFSEEGLEDKFIENLEPFILSGYFKDENLPDVVLKKICDHYFNREKYHNFERIVSKLNFSHYALFDQLETICKEKMLTTALIHLIITSMKGNDRKACLQILSNVFNRFKQAKKHKTLDNVKEMLLKDEESKFDIEASYEYIGLKLMYIIRLFLRGEKFPVGKLKQNQYPSFLSQSIEFLMKEDESIELMRLNARTFFSVVSEIFLNDYVADNLIKHNTNLNERGEPLIEYNHLQIVNTLQDRILYMQDEKSIKFEYSLFIIRIAGSQVCKENVDQMSNKVYHSIQNVLDELIKLKNAKESPTEALKKKYKYAGPDKMDQKQLEAEIYSIIHIYKPKFDDTELEELVWRADELLFDHIKIQLYEQKQEFDRCIDIYLNSPRVKKTDIFNWLFKIYQKQDVLKEPKIERLKEKLKYVIEELVVINSEDTGYIIDNWLPGEQNDIIKKLDRKPELQLQYLESYLKEREDAIKDAMAASARSMYGSKEANTYRDFLMLHVKLLAKNKVPALVDVVKKEYYPVQCLDFLKRDSSLLVKEAQAHLKKR